MTSRQSYIRAVSHSCNVFMMINDNHNDDDGDDVDTSCSGGDDYPNADNDDNDDMATSLYLMLQPAISPKPDIVHLEMFGWADN